MQIEEFNVEDFRLHKTTSPPAASNAKGAAVRRKQTEPFLCGPVPLAWLQRASCLPGNELKVGLVLWYLVGLKKQKTVKLSSQILITFGVKRTTGYRLLANLERAGLVAVKRHCGRQPVVTVLKVENFTTDDSNTMVGNCVTERSAG